MKKLLITLGVLGLWVVAGSAGAATIKYLDKAAAGTADGSSWTNAWTTFDAALQGSVTPAATDEVIVYVRDGTYTENSSSGAVLYLRQDYANQVTFRHDPEDPTPNVIIEPTRTTASSADTGTRVLSTTSNLAFEDVTFKASAKVLDNADAVGSWATTTGTTVTLNETTFYEGTGALNITKDGTDSAIASTTVGITAIYHAAGSNTSFSLYIKDSAALAKLATTGAMVVKFGSDASNYYKTTLDKSRFAVGWNHIWGQRIDVSGGTVGSPVVAAMDFLEVNLVADAAGTTWSEGDFIIDDFVSNAGAALTLSYSGTGINISNLTFRRVTFDGVRVSGYAVVSYVPNNTTGTNLVDGLTFDGCTFVSRTRTAATPTSNLYLNASKSTNYLNNLVIRDSTFSGGNYGLYIDGAPDFEIQSVEVTNALNYAFNIPLTQATQATTGTDTYGVIEDSYFETINTNGGISTHAAVVGTNQNNGNQIILRRNYFKSPASNGLVFKGTYSAVVESNIIETASSGGAALMFKGCTDCVSRNNYIIARGNGIGGSDDGANWKNTNATHYNNYIQAIGASGAIFSFVDQATELGGNYLDYNILAVASSTALSPYGVIGADTSLASLAEVQTAWAAYDVAYAGNDANSAVSDPLLVNITSDFQLTPLSSAIDTGTTTAYTTDFLGNPIYGPPDIGAYEYQPPYTMGTNLVATSSAIRLYGDEKFRVKAATTSPDTADLSVTITGADKTDWLDLEISTWENSDSYQKTFTASSSITDLATSFTVGDLAAARPYTVSVDGVVGADITGDDCASGVCTSNGSGQITFAYGGSFSTHEFEIMGDTAGPTRSAGAPSGTLPSGTTEATLSLTTDEAATCRYGTTAGVAYASLASTFTTTGGTTHSEPLTGLQDGTTYTYYIRCLDGSANVNDTDYQVSFTVAVTPAGPSGSTARGRALRTQTPAVPSPSSLNDSAAYVSMLERYVLLLRELLQLLQEARY